VPEEQVGKRHGGIHTDGDLNVEGEGHKLAGGDIIETDTYIASAVVQVAASPAPLGLLPPDLADFTGRDTELEQLERELLTAPGQAVLISAVHGKPGVGKSTLAVHLAHRLKEQFPDGQPYINLRGADHKPISPEICLTELLQILGVHGEEQPKSLEGKAALWRQRLDGRRVLVTLDNADNVAQVQPLLPGSSTCAVIVTSRRELATLGAKSLRLEILDSDEALELLTKIAGSERIAAEPDAAQAVLEVCSGLPLALRIAGARLKARKDWPVVKFADRLADEHRRLSELDLDDLDVRASFQLSYQYLDTEQARLFRLLSLWPGLDFHRWVAAALLSLGEEMAERVMDGLIAAQLLEPTAISGRFKIHDLIRLFACELLDNEETDADREMARVRLLEAAAERARVLDVALASRRPDPQKDPEGSITTAMALDFLEADRDGLVALTKQAADHGPWPVTWRLANRLYPFLLRRGYWADGEQVHRWSLQAARHARDGIAEAWALGNLGNVLAHQSRWQQAVEYLQQSVANCRELGNRHGEARALGMLGTVFAGQGHWDKAVGYLQEAIITSRELGDRDGEAGALGNLGSVLARQGHWSQAIDHLQDALTMCRELDDRGTEAQIRAQLGNVLAHQGHWSQAIDHLQHTLVNCRELGDRQGEATALSGLGNVLTFQGHWDQAIEYFQQDLTIRRELGDPYGEGTALSNLGAVLSQQGHWDPASNYLRQALRVFRWLGDPHGEGKTLSNLGNILTFQGERSKAIDHFQQALAIYRELGHPHGEAEALCNLGNVLAFQGDWDQAMVCIHQALAIYRELGDPHGEAQVLLNLAVLCRKNRLWREWFTYMSECIAVKQATGASEPEIRRWAREFRLQWRHRRQRS
jgi:tetratricopeptide (TPR) repeat protein